MSSYAFSTAGTLINRAAVEVGLTAVSDPYASTDQNFIQLCGLLQSLGDELWRQGRWQQMQQVYTFTTDAGVARYDLPADFGTMIDQTGWNRTNRLPLGGPLSPQEWEYLKAFQSGVVFTILFRPINQQLWFLPDDAIPADFVVAFEYLSRFWVIPTERQGTSGPWSDGISVTTSDYFTNGGNTYVATSTGTTGDSGPTGTGIGISDGGVTWDYVEAWGAVAPTTKDDLILYDPLLVVRGLKLAFLKAKGFDTAIAQDEFDTILEAAKADDAAAPVLSLNQSTEGYLLSDKNVPITGFGQ